MDMRTNAQIDQRANAGFAAHPRVVQQKAKYKDPYGGGVQEEYYPQNIMFDKRVVRGSTNATMVIPAGSYPDQLFDNRKERAQKKAQQRAAAAEEFFTRDVRTPEPLQGRQNIDIQTDQFVEELTDKAPCYEIGCQTEIKIERPQTPRFMPMKKGIDKKTCVEYSILVDGEPFFDYENEVEPILSVLCGKTLEQARMEVLEEMEIREMAESRDHQQRMMVADMQDIDRMEKNEEKRLKDFEKLKNQMKEKKKNRILAHKKVAARVISKNYMARLKENTYSKLKGVGFYTDQFTVQVLDNDVVPWLHSKVFEFVQDLEVQDNLSTRLAIDHLKSEQTTHVETVKSEQERKQKVKQEEERLHAEKMEQKRLKREKKERERKEAERKALREEVEKNFIEKGESKGDCLAQEILEIDGHQEAGKNVIGAVGGVLGQLILTLSILEKHFNRQLTSKSSKSKGSKRSGKSGSRKAKEGDAVSHKSGASGKSGKKSEVGEESKHSEVGTPAKDKDVSKLSFTAEPTIKEKGWWNKEMIQNFIHTYIQDKKKTEKIHMVVGHAYEQFLGGLEKAPMKLNEMRNMKEPNYSKLRSIIRDPTKMGDPVLTLLHESCESVGISRNSYNMIYEGFWDLYCKKPATKDLTAKKLDGWINNIVLHVPTWAPPAAPENEDDPPAEVEKGLPVKAVARIRIPLKRPEPEDGDGDPEDDQKVETKSQAKSQRSGRSNKKPVEPVIEEIDYEDRAKAVPTQGEGYQIYVVHQLAQRMLREHIAREFKEYVPELSSPSLSEDEMLKVLEKEAEEFEKKFFEQLYDDMPVFDFEIN